MLCVKIMQGHDQNQMRFERTLCIVSRCNLEKDLGLQDSRAVFPLLEISFVLLEELQEIDTICYHFIFLIITVCGKSKAESRELNTSIFRILILFFSLFHVLYTTLYLFNNQIPSFQV